MFTSVSQYLWAQKSQRYERLTTASGLSQSTISKIIQDKKGFLWFATSDGLNRYDGNNFLVFRSDPSDSTTLSGSDIFTMCEDDEGNMWAGTRNAGLNKIDLSTGKVYRFSQGPNGEDFSSMTVSSILNLGNHRVMVSATGLGLLVYDTRENKLIAKETDVKNPMMADVVRIFKHSKGSIWLGTRTGLLISRLGPKSYLPFKLAENNNTPDFRVRVINEAANGDILVGTEGQGLFRFNSQNQHFTRVFYHAQNPLSRQNIVTSLTKDAYRNLWIGTDNGVYVMNKEDFSSYYQISSNPDPDLGISSFSVTSLFTDSNLNTWVGTWEAGLNIAFYQKPRFSILRYKPNTLQGLLSNKVTAIAASKTDPDGVWIGLNVGLSYFNYKTGKIDHIVNNAGVNKLNSLADFDVTLMQSDKKGNLWIGVWGHGLINLTPQRKQMAYPYLMGNRAANLTAMNLMGDKLLLGTAGLGVIEFDIPSKKYRVPYPMLGPRNFSAKNISSLLVEANKRIWIGTTGFGLYIYHLDKHELTHIDKNGTSNGIRYNNISKIFQDRNKRIWVLSNGGGLHLYLGEGKGFRNFTVADGLASNTLRSMMEDKQGNLWISTNGGISKMNPKTFKFVNFDELDGLQGKEFLANAYSQNDKDWLFFGGANGLNFIKADSLRMKMDIPPIYLTGLKIFNKPVKVGEPNSPLEKDILQTKHLVLQPDQTVFSLDFVALEYQRPKNNRYAYILEGFDKDWNEVGTQRTATYTNLNPGDYIFKVKATNSDGVWGEKPFELKITVLPPWYRTWWAYGLYAMLFFGTVFGFMREVRIREAFKTDLRMKEIEKERIRELEQVKTHFFTNISHELRTPLTLIISPLEKYFLNNPQANKEQKSRILAIYQNAQKLLHLINQLLDLSKIEAGKHQPVIAQHDLILQMNGIIHGFEAYALQKQIKLKWLSPVESLFVYYDADIIEKCITNLLSNAFKHTPEDGTIAVKMELIKQFSNKSEEIQMVKIHVMDTGKGIDKNHLPHIFNRFYQVPDSIGRVGTGVGLSLCKELMDLHLGKIQVNSELGKGSDFNIEFPVNIHHYDASWIQTSVNVSYPEPSLLKKSDEMEIEQEKQILMVVDDHAEMRLFISDIFKNRFQIIEAERGEEALEMALKFIPDVVITDWMMPGMSGVNLCRALRQNPKTNHIPLLILTSKSSHESQIEGMQAGADDFVSKPFNADILEIRVNKLLETKERMRKNWQKQMIQQSLSEGKAPIYEDPFLQKATQLVIDNLSDAEFEVDDLEKGLDMSKMQLYRKLKNLTSLAGNEFIRSIRLQQAKLLLENSAYNISEIAYQVGFNDPAYFTRAFKKQYGKSPKSFIQQMQDEKS
ncbi:hybrid sensor histidine kinase/response regulator transcription factor [Aquirufa rosea]|uniref:histidine kinase n=1 Tax=Aquirufa rosea TaxID=2509241 RepID=A0A4V1M592_9BACT|nr:two-component regulator propeller domain-containing protein [Aquirufa rosea]RXK47540.1 hybrid sensor histidine kinase/response regulator [Aquirufa rosea]